MPSRPGLVFASLLAAACGPSLPPVPIAAAPPIAVVAISPPIAAEVAADEPPPPIPTSGGGWSLFHGDPARTGASSAPSIRAPRVLWHARVGIQGWLNSPVVAGALVLVPSSGDRHNAADPRDGVHALDLRTGKPLWQARFDDDANGAAVAGGRVVATSDDGNVYALDLQTGKVLWKRKRPGKVYASPLPLGDRVVVGDASGAVVALALADGAPIWEVKLDGAIRGGASSDGATIYAVSQTGEAAAISLEGKVAWRTALAQVAPTASLTQVYAAPLVTPTTLIIPFARDTYYATPALLALDKRTGKIAWEARGRGADEWGNVRMTPALARGVLVYGEAYSGDIVGVDAARGDVRFRTKAGACFFPSWASPAAAGDLVYVPRFDGSLSAIHPDGSLLWQLYLGEERHVGPLPPDRIARMTGCEWEVPVGAPLYAPPAVAEDGTLLVGSGEGVLYAIGEVR